MRSTFQRVNIHRQDRDINIVRLSLVDHRWNRALRGPLHGGANEAAMEIDRSIHRARTGRAELMQMLVKKERKIVALGIESTRKVILDPTLFNPGPNACVTRR